MDSAADDQSELSGQQVTGQSRRAVLAASRLVRPRTYLRYTRLYTQTPADTSIIFVCPCSRQSEVPGLRREDIPLLAAAFRPSMGGRGGRPTICRCSAVAPVLLDEKPARKHGARWTGSVHFYFSLISRDVRSISSRMKILVCFSAAELYFSIKTGVQRDTRQD